MSNKFPFMEEWKEYKLGDVCDLIPGFAFKSKDFGDYETKAIKIKDIKPPFVDTEGADGVCIEKYDESKLQKFVVKKGDFILAMTGATIGKIGRYIDDKPAYLNQRVLRFAPKNTVDKDFVYYFLSTHHFQTYIINHVDSESAQPNISGNTVGRYPIFLPHIETQYQIASIL
jgi:type I restriction enzyme S subunit